MDPETGRIFGHLACFGSCHRSIQAQCVMAPKSPSNYAQFHTSPSVRLDDGTRLRPKGWQQVPEGRRLVLHLPGGGGYGDPEKRSPQARADDLSKGYVTK